jgi:hypothetical protein
MTTKKRTFLIAGISIAALTQIALCLFVYVCFREFLGSVYSGRDCNYCNIDNIESRVRIDIPPVNDCECMYDADEDSKTVYFSVKMEKINPEKYITNNALKPLNTSHPLDLSHFFKLTIKPDITIENPDNYYYKIEDSAREFSIVLFDKLTGDLWIYLKYRDAIPVKYVAKSHTYTSF